MFRSRFIVLKNSEGGIPLTKLSHFAIEKNIKNCAGEVKNVTKLKSGGLMIECQRKQQSLNLLSLKQIHNIAISSTPHRTLNISRGIIRYRDEDLDDLTDDEICAELAPQGVFLTSPAQFLIFFSIAKCDNLVSGIPPSLLFKTINRDQLSETSISSSSLFSFFRIW
jgi:hypothetical protein